MPLHAWQKTRMEPRWVQHQREQEAFFDTIVEMTCKALRVPASMISAFDQNRHRILASHGVPTETTAVGEVPLSHSLCKHVIAMGRPLVVLDALSHPLVADSPTVREFGLVAYMGEPLHGPCGDVVGCFSAFDYRARDWTDVQRRMMSINAMVIERALNWNEDSAIPPTSRPLP